MEKPLDDPESDLAVERQRRGRAVVRLACLEPAADQTLLASDARGVARFAAAFDEHVPGRRERRVRPIDGLAGVSAVELRAVAAGIAESVFDHGGALDQRDARRRQVSPRQDPERRLIGGVAEVARAEQVRRAFEPRPAAGERHLDLMTRRDVVGELRLGVREAETQVLLGIQALDDQIEIAFACGEQPRPTLGPADRPFDDARGIDGADREMALHPVARSLAHQEVDFGRGAIPVTLGVGPVEQRDFLEDIAVDHRNRPAVVHLLNGVQQERRGDAFEREVHLPHAGAADRELAAEIVAGGDRRQHLHRPKRVVRQDAAQLLQLASADRVLGRDRRLSSWDVPGTGSPADVHRFGVRASSLGEHDRHVGDSARRDRHGALDEDEVHGGDVELLIPDRHFRDLESPVVTGDHGTAGGLQAHRYAADAGAFLRVNDDAADGAGRSRDRL